MHLAAAIETEFRHFQLSWCARPQKSKVKRSKAHRRYYHRRAKCKTIYMHQSQQTDGFRIGNGHVRLRIRFLSRRTFNVHHSICVWGAFQTKAHTDRAQTQWIMEILLEIMEKSWPQRSLSKNCIIYIHIEFVFLCLLAHNFIHLLLLS